MLDRIVLDDPRVTLRDVISIAGMLLVAIGAGSISIVGLANYGEEPRLIVAYLALLVVAASAAYLFVGAIGVLIYEAFTDDKER